MDERLKLTQRISGGPCFRVAATVVDGLGEEAQDWITGELQARGYEPVDLGDAVRHGRFIDIPIRKDEG